MFQLIENWSLVTSDHQERTPFDRRGAAHQMIISDSAFLILGEIFLSASPIALPLKCLLVCRVSDEKLREAFCLIFVCWGG